MSGMIFRVVATAIAKGGGLSLSLGVLFVFSGANTSRPKLTSFPLSHAIATNKI